MRKLVFRLGDTLLFEDSRVRKCTPKTTPKSLKNLKKISLNRFDFLHDKQMDLGTILEGKRDQKINKNIQKA